MLLGDGEVSEGIICKMMKSNTLIHYLVGDLMWCLYSSYINYNINMLKICDARIMSIMINAFKLLFVLFIKFIKYGLPLTIIKLLQIMLNVRISQ